MTTFYIAFHQSNFLLTKPSLSFPGLEETVTAELDVTVSPVLETAVLFDVETAVLFAVETADMPAVVCPPLEGSVVLSVVIPSRRREASVSG
jgi:hypothetical protein